MKQYLLIGTGILAGIIAGYLYWQEIGCLTGTCPLKSTWYGSTAYGALMGGLLTSLGKDTIDFFKKLKAKS